MINQSEKEYQELCLRFSQLDAMCIMVMQVLAFYAGTDEQGKLIELGWSKWPTLMHLAWLWDTICHQLDTICHQSDTICHQFDTMCIMVLQVPGFYAGIDEQGKLIELGWSKWPTLMHLYNLPPI